jgi:hypothetical protein
MTVKTTMEWGYEPTTFFEAPIDEPLSHGRLTAMAGKATYTLGTPADPLPPDIERSIEGEVDAYFKAWQVATGQTCTLGVTAVAQEAADGRRDVTAKIRGVAALVLGGASVDIVAEVGGKVIIDTRARRISVRQTFARSIAPKLPKSPVLRAMADSYLAAMAQPENELVYLYEILEAANEQHGGDHKTWEVLGIPRPDWRFLHEAACVWPLQQGRHRGQNMPNLRDATREELDKARAVARDVIEAFAARIP